MVIRHRVKEHIRRRAPVRSYVRGSGSRVYPYSGDYQGNPHLMMRQKEPIVLDPGDETTAYEIYLVESNDGELYRQQVEPFIKNYARKNKAGIYDRERAIQGLQNNLVPNAIARYKKDQGDIGPVSGRIKRRIAELWLPSIEEQAGIRR